MSKKVIMYTPAKLCEGNLTGGLKRFLELYKGLKNSNFNVVLFSGDEAEKIKQLGDENRSIKYVAPSKLFWIPSIAKSFIKNFKLINEIKRMNYDSLIVFDIPNALSFCVLRAPKIDLFLRQDLISYKEISISERVQNKNIKNIYLKLMKFSERICIREARRIIVQCEYDKKQLYGRHSNLADMLNRKTIIQINNVNPPWIVEKSIKTGKTIKNGRYKICFIGDFNNERKGQRIFLEAVRKIINNDKPIEVILIGGGSKLDSYKQEHVNYDEIKFLGRLEDPIRELKSCDLVVVPSLADSCPNTVMEALYNDVPVIGANSGGIPEILKNSSALFETNATSLQDKIEYYMDKDNLIELSEQQKKRKKELVFDWSATIIKHLSID